MMVMKDNYNKKISPFKFDYVNQMIKPVNVNVSFAVIDVLSTREVDLVYVLKFRFLMEYYDYRSVVSLLIRPVLTFHFRLKYHNLKKERSNNLLSRDEIDKVWIPYIVFENTEDSEATVGEDETEVTVTREGSYTESSVDVNEEINIFEGSENRVTFQQLYSKEFKCEYQLQLYPFDTQVISRQISGKSSSALL